MTTKVELEKLAEECQACADKDTASMDEHLESCPVCPVYISNGLKGFYFCETGKAP